MTINSSVIKALCYKQKREWDSEEQICDILVQFKPYFLVYPITRIHVQEFVQSIEK
jgi:hypothetical protein